MNLKSTLLPFLLLLASGCNEQVGAAEGPTDCLSVSLSPSAEDEEAFLTMGEALNGTWSIPWTSGPADFGPTVQISGGILGAASVFETTDAGTGNCPDSNPVRRVSVSNATIEADWLGSAQTMSDFYLEAPRIPGAIPTLIGFVDVDQPSAVFNAALLSVTEGEPVTGTRWNLSYSSYLTVDFESDGTVVNRIVASCPGPCEILPIEN